LNDNFGIKHLETKEIPVDKISLSQCVSRLNNITKKIERLAFSIQNVGLIQPVIVYPKGEGYELIVGQRRFYAVRDVLKLEKILAIIIEEPKSDEIKLAITFVENDYSSRIPMTMKDRIHVVVNLYSEGRSVKEIANLLGLSKKEIHAMIKLPRVPDAVRQAVEAAEIDVDAAMKATDALQFEKGVTDESEGEHVLELAKKFYDMVPDERRNVYNKLLGREDKISEKIILDFDSSEMQRLTAYSEKKGMTKTEAVVDLICDLLDKKEPDD
jgi:ParB/RepB/Spo0J family partition protein